jgi:hypothetical protein
LIRENVRSTNALPWLRDDLTGFIDEVRKTGFLVGLDGELRLQALFLRLSSLGIEIDTPSDAAQWLTPILAANAEEQKLIRNQFLDWAARNSSSPKSAVVPGATVRLDKLSSSSRSVAKPKPGGAVLRYAVTFVSVVLMAVAGYFMFNRGATKGPDVFGPGYGTSDDSIYGTELSVETELATVLGSFIALFFWRMRLHQSSVLAERRPLLESPERIELYFTEKEPYIFVADKLRHAFQAFRSHRRVESDRIDVQATIRATIRRGVRLAIRYSRRPQLPEYLLLIDNANWSDHLAKLGDLFGARLAKEELQYRSFYFGSDLRMLRDRAGRPHRFSEVAQLAADTPLIIISDGESLIGPLARSVRPWIVEATELRDIVLLTPTLRERWGHRERVIAAAGIVVLPATPEGILALGTLLSGGHSAREVRTADAPNVFYLSGTGRSQSICWLLDPEPTDSRAIVDALYRELPLPAFELFCAVSVFPHLRLDVTLYLGHELKRADGSPLLDEVNLGALSVMPWFRLGRIPDWLRRVLIAKLPLYRETQVRDALLQLLTNSTPIPQSQTSIPMSQTQRLERWDSIRQLAERERGSIYRDAIFLSFLRGDSLSHVRPEAPQELSQLMRRDTAFGWMIWLNISLITLMLLPILTSTVAEIAGTAARSPAYAVPSSVPNPVEMDKQTGINDGLGKSVSPPPTAPPRSQIQAKHKKTTVLKGPAVQKRNDLPPTGGSLEQSNVGSQSDAAEPKGPVDSTATKGTSGSSASGVGVSSLPPSLKTGSAANKKANPSRAPSVPTDVPKQ